MSARGAPGSASKQPPSKRPKALTGTGGGALTRGADLGGEKGEARRHVLRSAFVEIAPDLLNRLAAERRGLIEARIAAPVSRQQRQLDAAPARESRQFVDAVAPIVRAAEHARDHEPRPGAYALQIEIDREGMAERRKRSEPAASASARGWPRERARAR